MTEETARIEVGPALGWAPARSAGRVRWLALMLRALAALAVAAAGVGAALLTQTRVSIAPDASALARLDLSRLGGKVVRVSALGPEGRPVPLRLQGDVVLPRGLLEPGERITLTAVVRRPQAAGWLLGRQKTLRLTLPAPAAHLRQRWLHLRAGAPLRLRFDRPVVRARVRAGGSERLLLFARPRRTLPLGHWAGDASGAGTLTVAAVARDWERMPAPEQASWFPRGAAPQALVDPAPGRLLPRSTIALTFSHTTRSLFGDRLPRLVPSVPGRWLRTSSHSLSFTPLGTGFPLAAHVRLLLPRPLVGAAGGLRPAQTVAWNVPAGTTLRLQQLLAQLGYLPLAWTGSGPEPPATPANEVARAVSPPPGGSFSWRFGDIPPSLRELWQPGEWNTVTRGALMSFEDAHGLAPDGIAGLQVWRALLADALAGRQHRGGYSYVMVHQTVPQRLVLWHDGKVTATVSANTGIAVAPTPNGTWPVYLRFRSATMSGTNPDGTHYDDPGVPWISYFNGGDAIHGFPRSSYGVPQSLGCVELSFGDAQRVWPSTPVGTLVTVGP